MRRFIIVALCWFVFFCSITVPTDVEAETMRIDRIGFESTQEPIAIDIISPTEGEYLAGNITIKVNASLIQGSNVMLRWASDSWIDITDTYNATSLLFEYPMDVTCLPTGDVTFSAKHVTSHGAIQTSVEAYVDWQRPPILIVDDFYNATIEQYYTDALEALGYQNGTGYDVWRIETSGSPTTADLLRYQFVIWYKSSAASTILEAERISMETFLTNPSERKVLLTGTEIAWKAYQSGYELWLSFNFGVNDYIGDWSNTVNLIGFVGGPFYGANYSYGGGDGSRELGGIDAVRTMEFSQGIIEFDTSDYDEFAATLSPYMSGMFFGFAFDAISNQTGRIDCMNRTLTYFGLYDAPQVNFLSPAGSELVSSPSIVSWDSTSDIPGILYSPLHHIFVDGQKVATNWPLETYLLSMSDGNHTIRLVCEDNYGQRAYDSVAIEVDGTAPSVEVIDPAEESVLKSNIPIDFNLTDIHFQDAVARWDSDSWIPFLSPFQTLLPAGDGDHIFYVNATDEAGNWNYSQFTFICDDTSPDFTLTSTTNESVWMGGSIIELDISDAHLDKAWFRWDRGMYTEFLGDYEVSIPAGDGVHYLDVNATDVAGNWRVVHYQFITDDTAPAIILNGITNGTALRTGSQVNVEIDDLHFESVIWQWDFNDFMQWDDVSFVTYAPPVEGEHFLIVNATDKAGNSGAIICIIHIDNTAPQVSVVTPTEGSTLTGGTQITIDITDLHLDSVFFRWDIESWSEWGSPYVTFAPMSEGYHSLFINATDIAGNWIQTVFVFATYGAGTITATTTASTTATTTPEIDLPIAMSWIGIGVGIGVIGTIVSLEVLRRRRTTTS